MLLDLFMPTESRASTKDLRAFSLHQANIASDDGLHLTLLLTQTTEDEADGHAVVARNR